ncbi:hypothetical protein [Marinobacter sp. DUT-1]|uniref:hypothetical protein n=1 Tax=Marinobacter sp. DUT-1 TaxID=3412037 RepID=UPI003D17DC1A
MGVLTFALASSATVSVYFIGKDDHQDWILIAMSLGQVAASGIVIAIVVFFSERDVNTNDLCKRSERLFCETFPRACLLIDSPIENFRGWEFKRHRPKDTTEAYKKSPTKIQVSHFPGQIDSYYKITRPCGQSLTIRLQVNVGEVVVSYYIPAESEEHKDDIAAMLKWAFSRFLNESGYEGRWYFSNESFDGHDYASIHLTKNFDSDFLENERKKLFMANDVAASTRGIMKDCQKHSIKTSYS